MLSSVLENAPSAKKPADKWMYLNGAKPHEILQATRNAIIEEHEAAEDNEPAAVLITSEVRTI